MNIENILRPISSESKSRIGLLGAFVSPAIERAFRQRHFRDDLWLMCFLVIAASLRVSLLLLADYRDFGMTARFWPLLGCRVLFLLTSAAALFGLRRAATPEIAGRLFFGWCFLLVALTVFALSARPPDNTGLLLMSFGMVLVAYCVTPMPLARQALVALTYSAAAVIVSRRADSAAFSAVSLSYALSNLFGAVTSWWLNCRRREAFLAEMREAELRASLEEAVAEIRTLRGLLCICAWCKRIRDETESWQTVEMYVQSRTEASFTHGICPDCLQVQARQIGQPCGK